MKLKDAMLLILLFLKGYLFNLRFKVKEGERDKSKIFLPLLHSPGGRCTRLDQVRRPELHPHVAN